MLGGCIVCERSKTNTSWDQEAAGSGRKRGYGADKCMMHDEAGVIHSAWEAAQEGRGRPLAAVCGPPMTMTALAAGAAGSAATSFAESAAVASRPLAGAAAPALLESAPPPLSAPLVDAGPSLPPSNAVAFKFTSPSAAPLPPPLPTSAASLAAPSPAATAALLGAAAALLGVAVALLCAAAAPACVAPPVALRAAWPLRAFRTCAGEWQQRLSTCEIRGGMQKLRCNMRAIHFSAGLHQHSVGQ